MRYTVEVTGEFTLWFKEGTTERHREDGPAFEYANGDKKWFINGHLHRADEPACEWFDGSKFWFQNGLRHREDGPACEYVNGDKLWFQNDLLHREDGPACEYYSDGSKRWFINDEEIHCKDNEEFLRLTQNKPESCADKIVEIDGKKYKLSEVI